MNDLSWKRILGMVVGFAIGFSIYTIYYHQFNVSVFIGTSIAIVWGLASKAWSSFRGKTNRVLTPAIDERTVTNWRKFGGLLLFILLFVVPFVAMGIAVFMGYRSIPISLGFFYLFICMIVLSVAFGWVRRH